MSSLKRSPHDFVFKQELGNGSYSRVYKAVDKGEPQRVYAVKVCSKRHIINENKVKYVTIEKNTLNLLARAHHPGIVKLHYTFHDEENLYFVLDFAAGGELLALLHRVGRFSEIWARHFIAQLIDTTEFIHSQGVIHRDLKPENVLLHRDGRLMVTDFGTATNVNRDNGDKGASFVGTAEYVSPELLLYNQCEFASDVWALGCMLYQFVQGSPPFRGENELQTFEKIVSLEYPWANNTTGGVVALVRRILTLDPSDRPTLSAIKQDKWFESVDWRNRELLWRGIWQVQPQRQQQLQNTDMQTRNSPVAKQKRRKPAKVANTTSSIVEWRKQLGIANEYLTNPGGPNASSINTRKAIKPAGNLNGSTNNMNNGTNGRPAVRSNSMSKVPALSQVQSQAELQPRLKSPSPKSSGNIPKTPMALKPQLPPGSNTKVLTTPAPLNRVTIQQQLTQPQQSLLVPKASSTPNFSSRVPSPVGKTKLMAPGSIPKAPSPIGKAPALAPALAPATYVQAPTPAQPPILAPFNKPSELRRAPAGSAASPPESAAQTSATVSSVPIPPTIAQAVVGKPQSPAPRTAPPKLSVDTGQRPSVMTNGSTAVIATTNSGSKTVDPTIIKQDSVNIFEIPFNGSGPDMSLQSYKRVDNELITQLVGEHKSELRPSGAILSLLTLYKNGTLQYKQKQSVHQMANIGDTSLSMYDYEFYDKQARGFLILEKYHCKLWFISLPRGNALQQSSQGAIVNADENWVDCIFRARQLVEDQKLADRLNNVEVSSPRALSPTIPVTPIYAKARTISGGSFTPQKKYAIPSNIVVSSSRKQVLHAINRNGGGDASLGASAAFKSLQKK